MDNKVFFGKVDKKQTQYGELIKLGFSKDDLIKMQQNLNEKGWINIVVKTNKDGKSYMEKDDYQPKVNQNTNKFINNKADYSGGYNHVGDLPF